MPIAKGVGKGYNLFWFCFFRYTLGNTAQFPPNGLSTAPAAAAPRSPYRHLELCGIALTFYTSLPCCLLRQGFFVSAALRRPIAKRPSCTV
ncbi:MAG: hypothetical protein PUF35_01340 [Subdoligranulum sp.]|nr:hypothetical protein [Subdoligranulum sp.]